MEAPEKNNEHIVCPRCFARITSDAEYCSECGYNFDGSTDSSDSEVYADLTKANLLRMRGETKEATNICLAILRKLPNNMTAHSLLGDIYLEQEDYQQAIQWYEMALDLSPNSPRELQQLDIAQRRQMETQAAQSLEQLNIEKKPFNPTLLGVIIVVSLLAVAGFAYWFGQNSQKTAQKKPVIDPINIGTEEPVSQPNEIIRIEPPLTVEKQLLNQLHQPNLHSMAVETLTVLQEQGHIIATSAKSDQYPDSAFSIMIADEIFNLDEKVQQVTIRIQTNGTPSFQGTLSKATIEQCRIMNQQGTPIEEVAAFAFQGNPPNIRRDENTNSVQPPQINQEENTTETTNQTGNGAENQPQTNSGL